jgi:hypothetical protein
VKATCTGYRVIILFIVFAFPPFALSDPFMGEGKQAYIERCGYQDVLKSIKSSDSVALAQQKMNNMAQRFARECIGKMPNNRVNSGSHSNEQ